MFLRWEIIRGWMPGIVFAAIAVAIEILYFEYMLSRGLADETFSVSLGIVSLPLSIALFLSLGNAIVLLVLWMSVFESTAYVMAGPDRRVRRLLYPLRMIRAGAVVLAPFTLVLFAPYSIESGWFISVLSGASNSDPFLQQPAAGLSPLLFRCG